MKKFIAIAGNIGSGKTNLAKKLANHFGWEYFQEPFEENPYLEKYYQDMGKWAFKCEVFFLGRRLQDHLQIIESNLPTVQDRCIYEGAEVFVKNLYQNRLLDEADWQTYNNLYKAIKKTLTPPELIIYAKSSTDRCIKNITKRNRNVEFHLNNTYISDLNHLYEEWSRDFKDCPIIIANGDQNDFKYNEKDFLKLAEKIKKSL